MKSSPSQDCYRFETNKLAKLDGLSNIEVLSSTLTRKILVLLSKKRIHGSRIILKTPNDIIDILYHFFPIFIILVKFHEFQLEIFVKFFVSLLCQRI